MTTMLFKDLITEYSTDIKTYMNWENYGMNDVIIPLEETLKNHSLVLLMNSYGSFTVEEEIIEPLCADVFIYFPILMQQLAISRLMDAFAVVQEDINTDTLTRTEVLASEIDQASELTVGTTSTDTNILNTEQKTTGTVGVVGTADQTTTGTADIENTSGVDMTGNRNVNFSHAMPEQSISGGSFPVDPEGTPILSTSYVQTATESFNTSNPIATDETSSQTTSGTNSSESEQTTTNNVTVADTGTNTRTNVNSGKDMSDSTTTTDSTNTITETRTTTATNKQYAYEIKAFLESTETLNAFKNWEDRFSWVVGII